MNPSLFCAYTFTLAPIWDHQRFGNKYIKLGDNFNLRLELSNYHRNIIYRIEKYSIFELQDL